MKDEQITQTLFMFIQTAENLGWTVEREEGSSSIRLSKTTPSGLECRTFAPVAPVLGNVYDYISDSADYMLDGDFDESIAEELSEAGLPSSQEAVETEKKHELAMLDELKSAFAFVKKHNKAFNPNTDELFNYRESVIARVQKEFDEFFAKEMKKSKEEIFKDVNRVKFYVDLTEYLTSKQPGHYFDQGCFSVLYDLGENILKTLYNEFLLDDEGDFGDYCADFIERYVDR